MFDESCSKWCRLRVYWICIFPIISIYYKIERSIYDEGYMAKLLNLVLASQVKSSFFGGFFTVTKHTQYCNQYTLGTCWHRNRWPHYITDGRLKPSNQTHLIPFVPFSCCINALLSAFALFVQ